MTTLSLDALAKRLPVIVSNGHRREMDVLDGDLFFGDDGERLDPDHIAAALNEWAELRAYRERTEAALLDVCECADDDAFESLKKRLTKHGRGLWREPGQGAM